MLGRGGGATRAGGGVAARPLSSVIMRLDTGRPGTAVGEEFGVRISPFGRVTVRSIPARSSEDREVAGLEPPTLELMKRRSPGS